MPKRCSTRCRASLSRQAGEHPARRAGGTYCAQGTLQALTVTPGTDGVLATIELEPDAAVDALPDGIYARWQSTPIISPMFQ